MAQPITSLLQWLGQLDAPRVTYWHSKIFLIAVAYILGPVILAISFNEMDWKTGAIVLLGLFTMIDLWVITYPWLPGGVSLAGYIAGQPGRERGWSIKDGVDRMEGWLGGFYSKAVITILGRHAALVVLAFLPVTGFGDQVLLVLCIIPVVVLGALKFTTDPWVVKWIWWGYITIFCAAMAYWVLVWQVPSLRQSAALREVHQLETVVAQQNDQALQERVRIIKDKLAKLPAHLTMVQREATLTDDERKDLKEARSGRTPEKVYGKTAPVVVDSASGVAEWFLGLYQRGFDFFFYGETIDIPITSLQSKDFCDKRLPENGRVNFTLLTEVDLIVAGGSSGITSYFRINGVKSGGTIETRHHCVKVGFAHPDPSYLRNRIEPQNFQVEFGAGFWGKLLWAGGLVGMVFFVLPWVGRRIPIVKRAFRSPVPSGH